jgi:type VI secretion system protein ImpE
LTQLNVAGEMDAANLPMLQTYRELLQCEALRAEVFRGMRSPLLFGAPDEWMALLLQSLKALADGQINQAEQLREQAYESAVGISGTINGEPFEWLADADSRIGPFLEVVVNGRYYWVPFSRIKSISFFEPEDLRDLVWAPAEFVWANDGQAVGMIPVRYPGSEDATNNAIRLARVTQWTELSPQTFAGIGQKMFVTDAGDYPLLEVHNIELNVAADGATAENAA